MKNNSMHYLQSKITEILDKSLNMEQRSELKAVIEDAKTMNKEEMKRICFNTLETCDDPITGSLNDYFEIIYKQTIL